MIGPGNRLAHAAALAVAELPGEAYNPLFLHGPPGLGKTHLLGAIVEYLRRNRPELAVHYTTAERFTAEFVASLRRDGPDAFKARYRELDALLIDDVQVLEGKQHTEEEFVHTFNTLHAAGKQIVLSSDRPPEALSRLAERLRDRFNWGLRVELDPPDLRTRIAVVWRMATDSCGQPPEPGGAPPDRHPRRPTTSAVLEGAMTRVLAFASLLGEPLTSPIVHRALGSGEDDAPPPSAEPPDARGDPGRRLRRQRPAARRPALHLALAPGRPSPARSRCTWPASSPSLSLAEIARAFDRDHTTVMHAVRAVVGSPRARLRDRRRNPQDPRHPGDTSDRDGPVHRFRR